MVEARYRLGHLLLKLGRKEESQKELDRVARVNRLENEVKDLQEFLRPGAPRPRKGGQAKLGMARQTSRLMLLALRFDDAADSTEQALVEFPGQRDVTYYHTLALLGQGRIEEAHSEFRSLRRRFPEFPPIRDGLARLERWRDEAPGRRPSRVDLVEEMLESYPP
jgi:tetratricopeptide (TPR) repeat protein